MTKIVAVLIIHLCVVFEPHLAQVTVSWDVNRTAEFKNGDTMELICTVAGTTCCASLRSWDGGSSFSSLMNNGVPSNAAKYHEIINTNSFSLFIYNMDRSDFLYDYRCSYGFDSSLRSQLTPPANARYVPAASEIQELSSSTVNEKLNFEVNVTTVFPAPSCTAEFGGADISSSMTLTTTDDFPFKFAVLSMSNVAYTCPGSLDVSCSVGSYSFNVLTLDPCDVTTEGTTEGTGGGGGGSSVGALIAGIVSAFIVIIVIPIIICCLFNKRCRSRYLRKDSRFSFTCPGKDIVVMDIYHDNDFKIVRPTGKKIEIQCVRTEKGCYEFNNKVLSDGNGVRVMNNPCMLFNPFFEICSLEMEHQGSYMYKRYNSSENGCILTMEICNDIVDIGLRPASFSAKIGDSIQIRYTREIVPQQLIFRAMRSGTNQIAPQPEVTKITNTAPLLIKEISKKDEGGYLFASSNGNPLSGVLTLSVMKGNESKPIVYLGQSENGISAFQPRNGANTVLDAIPTKEDIQENPDKKKKKKGKKKEKKEGVSETTRGEKEEVEETTNEEKDTT